MPEAALGTRIEVPTVEGKAQLKIPAGTESGQKFRLRERGFPSLRNPQLRGDEFIEVKITLPKVISEETKKQLKEKTGSEIPDYVLACVGGGSNAMGMFYHFLDDEEVKLIAIEAGGKGVSSGESAATTLLGREGVLHGSRSILMQTPDGQVTEPYSISAGLDYPGIGPQHAHLFKVKRAEYVSITDDEAMQAGLVCARLEGIIPAIESAHALAHLEKMQFTGNETIVVCLSGRGDKDLDTYMKYFDL